VITPIAEHWDGRSWTQIWVPSPHHAHVDLTAVSELSPTDVWATGRRGDFHTNAVFEHWNGLAWSIVAGAGGLPEGDAQMLGISVGADGVLAVGAFAPKRHQTRMQTLVESCCS
jgi:hypothetical protein